MFFTKLFVDKVISAKPRSHKQATNQPIIYKCDNKLVFKYLTKNFTSQPAYLFTCALRLA
ncbi:CLUMA_CG019773, isoform A [Clunio marinus]|uniref:CLUMA_CG019773, isoform A n=1 Tax=Clunio marinus TaxID=568069 RepID=A0A1J1J4P1_9DIPT|nr:CLUMA_CG019773, isoform A [Clunio marinus]